MGGRTCTWRTSVWVTQFEQPKGAMEELLMLLFTFEAQPQPSFQRACKVPQAPNKSPVNFRPAVLRTVFSPQCIAHHQLTIRWEKRSISFNHCLLRPKSDWPALSFHLRCLPGSYFWSFLTSGFPIVNLFLLKLLS